MAPSDARDDLERDQVTVHFIGAGPGAADLITVRGRDLIAASPVCLYAGALVPVELLEHCPPDARKVDTARLDLDEILAELVKATEAGLDVARLHSGDPAVFSAMAEQMHAAGCVGDPLRRDARSTGFCCRGRLAQAGVDRAGGRADGDPDAHRGPGDRDAAGEDLATLGASRGTIVLHLAVQYIERLVDELTPNYGADCPVAVVARASREDEVILRGTLADIAAQVREAGILRTAVVIVGKVLAAENFRDSHLYSTTRSR